MPFTKLTFRPGINREITSYSNEGGWFDCDKVRFQKGFPEQIGGWQKFSSNAFNGTCRALHPWVTLNAESYLGVGTNTKYYINYVGDFNDITPIRDTTAAGDVTFSASSGSTTLTVSDTNHGAVAGDFVTFSGAVSLGGNITAAILNQEYEIASIVDANSYTITASVAANASDTGNGGSSTVGAYQINVGLDTSVSGSGWGTDTWGAGAWGEASTVSVETGTLRLWSHDNYGEDLLINVRDGNIYYWDASAVSALETRAVPLSSLSGANTTPTVAKQILISDTDRHIIALGCDDEFNIGTQDPMLIRFSDQESLTDWRTLPDNTAGSLRLSSGSEIVCGIETRQQILIFTDTTLYGMQFLGPPFTFGISTLAEGITIMSPNAGIAAQDRVFWMGKNEFYVFAGSVQRLPCSVRDYIFDDIDESQEEKVVSGLNSEHSEIWWFYPSSSGNGNVDKYVVYNFAEDSWYYGTLSRSAWVDRGVNEFPIAAGLDGYLYNHEVGVNDGSQSPSVAIQGYIESSPISMSDGNNFMFISKMIPDVNFMNSSNLSPIVDMTLSVRNFPDGTFVNTETQEFVKTQSVPVDQRTEQLFFRLRGRQVSFKIANSDSGVRWRLGTPRIDIRADGRR